MGRRTSWKSIMWVFPEDSECLFPVYSIKGKASLSDTNKKESRISLLLPATETASSSSYLLEQGPHPIISVSSLKIKLLETVQTKLGYHLSQNVISILGSWMQPRTHVTEFYATAASHPIYLLYFAYSLAIFQPWCTKSGHRIQSRQRI